VTDEVKDGRSDEDAGEDLSHDGGDPRALGELGRELGGEQDDQDVDEDVGDVQVASSVRSK
jgi:hypothetical protein